MSRQVKYETVVLPAPTPEQLEAMSKITIHVINGCDWYMLGKVGFQDFGARINYTFGRIGDRTCVVEAEKY